jgi:quinol monooxygenase YgiN
MGPVVYVDRSDIRPGCADELEAAARQLVEHVATNKGRAFSYGIYFSAETSTMTVVHVHPDTDSLEQLMAAIAPRLAPFRDLLQLRSIDVYGSPSDAVLAQLRAKVALLGGSVKIHERVAGVDADVLAREPA